LNVIHDLCWGSEASMDNATLSDDLREHALARFEVGETPRSIATSLRISPSCVSKWKKLPQNARIASETQGMIPYENSMLSADGMIISRAFAWACLTFLGWTLLLVAGLLVLLVTVQHLRADALAQPVAHLVAATVSAGLGWLCRLMARRLL
jgi:hypothetical protein